MKKKVGQKYLILIVASILIISSCPNPGLAFSRFSDLITNSGPGMPSDHAIVFRNNHTIQASGRIVITPEAGQFFIMDGFDYNDVDLATSSDRNDFYTERNLDALPTADADGVSVVASTTNGSITINLNSTAGINSGDYVRIKLGQIAIYQTNGDSQIINPLTTGPYDINVKTFSDAGNLLDDSSVPIFIIRQVTMSTAFGKRRFNGTPSGVLTYGTNQSYLSLMTNYLASCRFTAIASSSYADMSNTFSYTGGYYHSYLLTGLVNGQHYTYYVKCMDAYAVEDDTEFIIDFSVSGLEGTTGDEGGIPGRGGGGAGGGSGGGGGGGTGAGTGALLPYPPPPGTPSVILQGLAYPDGQIYLLQDGTLKQNIKSDSQAQFLLSLYDLVQGVYTFGVWAEDADKRSSLTQSFTFWLREGTKTEVYKIFIPPTIQLAKNAITAGENVNVTGISAPNSNIEVWLYPQKQGSLRDDEILKTTTKTDSTGRWSAVLTTLSSFKGVYKVKAKASNETMGQSDFSKILDLGIGVSLSGIACPGADLNKDGKVNLIDFSILLYYWNTDNSCADQNQDGTVNLVDFSIMMYYWTG